MLLASAGCHPLIVTDKLDYRLDLAVKLGATHTFNPTRDDAGRVRPGPDRPARRRLVFEAAGDPQTFTQMIDCAAPAAHVAVLGIPVEDRLAFRHSTARRKGLDVRMVRRSNRTLDRAINWRCTAGCHWACWPAIAGR